VEERQITAAHLRPRAAHYRELLSKATDPLYAARYIASIEALDAEADAIEGDPGGGASGDAAFSRLRV
jgi:hypothetical protein